MDLRVTLKFLPSDLEPWPLNVRLVAHNDAFRIDDDVYAVANRRETILPICVPRDRPTALRFETDRSVRRVLLGVDDLPFAAVAGGIVVTLPALLAGCQRTADLHTLIDFTGVRLRVEHADPLRRSGKYAAAFPAAAHRAAVTVEFALLEAIRRLGLDRSIGLGPFGPILLMGFDTNNPCGHEDFPPHIHIHMARPAFGAEIGHYYFGEDGLFSHNVVCERQTTAADRVFGRGAIHRQRDPNGNPLFDIAITEEGWLRLTSPQGEAVTIRPAARTYADGALLGGDACWTSVEADPDIENGTIAATVNEVRTIHRFDQDTGRLIGSTKLHAADLQAADCSAGEQRPFGTASYSTKGCDQVVPAKRSGRPKRRHS